MNAAVRLRAAPLTPLPLPSWLPAAMWPFDTKRLEVDGTTVAVAEVGRGPTLLFYTGIGSIIWRDVMLRLSNDFRCIVMDPPGIGLSGPVARSATNLRASARAVDGVIRAMDLDSITLVVHDTGGPPALVAAAGLAGRIRGIVAVNTFGWRPAGRAFRGMLALMGSGFIRRINLVTDFLSRITTTSFGVGRHLDASARRVYRVAIARGKGAFHDYLRDARREDALFRELSAAFEGPLAGLPLLTIFGERNDPLGFQPQWKALFPRARQVVVKDGNHFPMCDAPDLVAGSIRTWLEESGGEAAGTATAHARGASAGRSDSTE